MSKYLTKYKMHDIISEKKLQSALCNSRLGRMIGYETMEKNNVSSSGYCDDSWDVSRMRWN